MARSSLSAAPTEGFCLAFPQQIASPHTSQPTVAFPLGGMGLATNILATPGANLGARAHLHAHPSTSGVPRAQHVAAHLHMDLDQSASIFCGDAGRDLAGDATPLL
ncbi:hypothetical protein KFE25_011744 [Diacronema lutheri]|uniref:Uncharacterized protein n=1 Tax=Diacronema lutheri TaxID=2081491 RepID=A0A8J6C5R0_DIALT|nr:hypothetical protein KFE25_011744 [Diacronema lutheri]